MWGAVVAVVAGVIGAYRAEQERIRQMKLPGCHLPAQPETPADYTPYATARERAARPLPPSTTTVRGVTTDGMPFVAGLVYGSMLSGHHDAHPHAAAGTSCPAPDPTPDFTPGGGESGGGGATGEF